MSSFRPSASRLAQKEMNPESAAARREVSREAATHDAELVRRFNAGDESAFTEIASRHRERIYAIAHRLLRNHADAEEIAQDTLVRAYRGLARFRGDSSLATWLHHVALNLARNRYWYFHRRRRHASVSLDCPLTMDGTGTFADLVASPAPEPTQDAMTGEFTELVAASMQRLAPGHREILSLRNVLNRSYDEIAEALGIEVGTVKSRIARARGQLRALMEETCPEFAAEVQAASWFEPTRARAHLVNAA
jgi:RNA polymerase sigma-70 factor (ECF subfamily)